MKQKAIPKASRGSHRSRKIPAWTTAAPALAFAADSSCSPATPHRMESFSRLSLPESGTPYNITIGNDLTANNQFNARPTYGTCGAANVVSTPFGCLNTNPLGTGEKIIPYNLGVGPSNVVFHIRVSKVFGIGPKIEGASGANGPQANTNVSGRGLDGGQAQVRIDATVPRKYSLTLVGAALNVFNIVNLGTPNGVMNSSLFGQTQSLASGPYGSPTPG